MKKRLYAFTAVLLSAMILVGCNASITIPTLDSTTSENPVQTTVTTQATAVTTTTAAAVTTTPAVVTTTQTATTSVTTTSPATAKPAEPKPEPETKFKSKEDILVACSSKASCETNINACRVDVESKHPYDVIYDYGEAYKKYIQVCDWSLVFDVEYYKQQFPILALQYHNDDAQLLEHFQTVGVHEGRQGSANFNVGAYRMNSGLKSKFGRNFAAYYIYYMLNYSSERNINTRRADDGTEVYRQYTMAKTILQATEVARINEYRSEVGANAVAFDSEMAALANLRAYHNAHDGYKAHDWAKENNVLLKSYFRMISDSWSKFGENNYENYRKLAPLNTNFAEKYRNSPPHYECMVRDVYTYVGVSNFYSATGISEQFDVYIDGKLKTAMYE